MKIKATLAPTHPPHIRCYFPHLPFIFCPAFQQVAVSEQLPLSLLREGRPEVSGGFSEGGREFSPTVGPNQQDI